jgi:hypothetical protein
LTTHAIFSDILKNHEVLPLYGRGLHILLPNAFIPYSATVEGEMKNGTKTDSTVSLRIRGRIGFDEDFSQDSKRGD